MHMTQILILLTSTLMEERILSSCIPFSSVTSTFLKTLLSRHKHVVKAHQMSGIRLIVGSHLLSIFDLSLLMGMDCP